MRNRRRVLIIMSALSGGGAEKVVIDYLKRFDRSKFKIDLCLVVKQGVYLSEVPSDVNLLSLYENNSFFPYRFEHIVSRLLRINLFQRLRTRRVVKDKYDVVLSFMEGIPVKFHQYLFDRAPKHISWVHIELVRNHYTKGCFYNFVDERNIYSRMDTIVSVAKETENQVKELFGVDTEYKVLLNPIDRDDIILHSSSKNVTKSKFTICSVGRMTEPKRFDRLIRASARLKSKGYDFELWLVGQGDLEDSLKEMSRDLGLDNIVKFLGFQSPSYPFIKQADLFVSTSEVEGFSLVICEALCLGVPVISTRTAGPTEILANSKYGLLCDHDDESIYKAIKSMMDSPEQLAHYRKMAEERGAIFDITSTMKQFEDLLSE